jgi:hypothetical protein
MGLWVPQDKIYLDNQCYIIIGHEGIFRFLPFIGKFWNAIKAYCQKNRLYIDHHGRAILVPGLDKLPFNICGFIDDRVNLILVPYSGPAGDTEGAPCWLQYILAQESVYSGHEKVHGHKMETVFFPNGMSTCFGPVTTRQNDWGTLFFSGLD